MVNPVIILLIGLAIAIWLITEVKHFKHKIVAIFVIVLFLMTYFSIVSIIKHNDIDIKTSEGMKQAGKLYFAWLGHAFGNVKVITSNAINMDWRGNESLNESNKTELLN